MSSSALSIYSNIVSLAAQRGLAAANESLASSFEKLSSGFRINKASDDAAGLAIASSLKADMRIYSQGIRNLNDGVSLLNIADSSLGQLATIAVRIQELAAQAASGTVGWRQRESLDGEAQSLAEEYLRIAQTTRFNGIALFDGSLGDLRLQAGYGADGGIAASLGGAMGEGTFSWFGTYAGATGTVPRIAFGELNGDGALDLVSIGSAGSACVRLGNGDGTFRKDTSYIMQSTASAALSLDDMNADGVLDLVTAGTGGLDGFAAIRLGRGDGTFGTSLSYKMEEVSCGSLSPTDVNADGVLDLVTAGRDITNLAFTTVRLGNGNGTFRAASSYFLQGYLAPSLASGDINGDGKTDLVVGTTLLTSGGGLANVFIGNGDGSFSAGVSYALEGTDNYYVTLADLNGDRRLDLLSAGKSTIAGFVTVRLGNGDGTFQSASSFDGGTTNISNAASGDLNGDGKLDILTIGTGAKAGVLFGRGDGTFSAPQTVSTSLTSRGVALGDINGDGVQDLAVGSLIGSAVNVLLANTKAGVSALLPFSLRSQSDALQAIPLLKQTLENLATQRGAVGALQSRVRSALNAASGTVEGCASARSRVEDSDIAMESSKLLRQQILQEAASAVLAHANRGPALALQLLS